MSALSALFVFSLTHTQQCSKLAAFNRTNHLLLVLNLNIIVILPLKLKAKNIICVCMLVFYDISIDMQAMSIENITI